MLRITVHDNLEALAFQLEGTLAGPWVREVEECWRRTLADRHRPTVRFDLTGVTFIDDAARPTWRRCTVLEPSSLPRLPDQRCRGEVTKALIPNGERPRRKVNRRTKLSGLRRSDRS